MKLIATNKKARHDYHLLESYEAGIVLKGTEIKSIRAGKVNIRDSYCLVRNGEMLLLNMHVAKYHQGNQFNHDETRTRKLLLHKKQIIKIENKINQDSITVIPTKVYLDKGLCKVEISLAKGKKQYDKRQTLKERDAKRSMERSMKERY